MLVVSLRVVNFRFWSHLGCSGQNAIIISREGLVQGCTRKNIKNIYIVCVLTQSLLGVKKCLGHAQIGLLQGFNSKFPTSIPTPSICAVPPGFRVILHSAFCIQRSAKYPCRSFPGMNLRRLSNSFVSLNLIILKFCFVIKYRYCDGRLMLGRQFLSAQVFDIL